jgi:hypothetical protein
MNPISHRLQSGRRRTRLALLFLALVVSVWCANNTPVAAQDKPNELEAYRVRTELPLPGTSAFCVVEIDGDNRPTVYLTGDKYILSPLFQLKADETGKAIAKISTDDPKAVAVTLTAYPKGIYPAAATAVMEKLSKDSSNDALSKAKATPLVIFPFRVAELVVSVDTPHRTALSGIPCIRSASQAISCSKKLKNLIRKSYCASVTLATKNNIATARPTSAQ